MGEKIDILLIFGFFAGILITISIMMDIPLRIVLVAGISVVIITTILAAIIKLFFENLRDIDYFILFVVCILIITLIWIIHSSLKSLSMGTTVIQLPLSYYIILCIMIFTMARLHMRTAVNLSFVTMLGTILTAILAKEEYSDLQSIGKVSTEATLASGFQALGYVIMILAIIIFIAFLLLIAVGHQKAKEEENARIQRESERARRERELQTQREEEARRKELEKIVRDNSVKAERLAGKIKVFLKKNHGELFSEISLRSNLVSTSSEDDVFNQALRMLSYNEGLRIHYEKIGEDRYGDDIEKKYYYYVGVDD